MLLKTFGMYKFLWTVSIVCLTASCTRNNPDPPPPSTATAMQLIADSVYLFSKEAYYWNTALPDYTTFNPRQYTATDELSTAKNVLAKIRDYNNYDKDKGYSHAVSYEEGGLNKAGEAIAYGFFVKDAYTIQSSFSYTFKGWYVSYVYPDSDAGMAGVQRGWKVNKINGTVLNNTDATVSILNDVFTQDKVTTATFEFIKPDGNTQTHTFTIKKFVANPVLHQQVITTPALKKVGYVVFNSFFNGGGKQLVTLFSNLQSQGIDELVLDLRYNSGGITNTQDTLAYLLAPAAATGNLMTTYDYNQQLLNNNYPLLKQKFRFPNDFFKPDFYKNKVYFNKIGGLALSRIFIIVSDRTASASELLINNLRPVMDVQLIGDAPTFGKPVGSFGIDLMNKVTIYPVSFRTTNKNGEGDYYAGFNPRQYGKTMYDGVDRNWGDPTEDCLYGALYYINNGVYPTGSTTTLPRSVLPSLRLKLSSSVTQMIRQ